MGQKLPLFLASENQVGGARAPTQEHSRNAVERPIIFLIMSVLISLPPLLPFMSAIAVNAVQEVLQPAHQDEDMDDLFGQDHDMEEVKHYDR
jgi:hypothetical protein